jgi:hypothetical protein
MDEDPLIWMLLLERGRQTGDFVLASRAQKELGKMGIRVSYGLRHPPKKAGKPRQDKRANDAN